MGIVQASDWDVKRLFSLQDTERVAEFVSDCMRQVDNWYYNEGDDGRRPTTTEGVS